MATPSLIQLFPSVRVHHIASSLSDHCPLWICTDDENLRFYKKMRPFHFEAVWMRDERCEGVIHNAWGVQVSSTPTERLVNKIEACHIRLQSWGRLSSENICPFLVQIRRLLVRPKLFPWLGKTIHKFVSFGRN